MLLIYWIMQPYFNREGARQNLRNRCLTGLRAEIKVSQFQESEPGVQRAPDTREAHPYLRGTVTVIVPVELWPAASVAMMVIV